MSYGDFRTCLEDWEDLEKEFTHLEEDHKQYVKALEQMNVAQKKCLAGIAHQRYRLRRITESLKKCSKSLTPEQQAQAEELQQKMKDRKDAFHEMEECLPHKNGVYLSIILGQVSVSLLDKADKYRYKQEYEKFKLTVTYVIMCQALFLTFFSGYRAFDAILNFLLVWYYCTLTIRESILTVNGSRIKGWWLTHHFISTVCAGISLIWPDGETYQKFRMQFVLFTLYLSIVYVLQYYYQSGCLYRLRCLGQSHTMDITVEGFMSWMWKGLAFLLPFLFFGYFFQLYNAYTLLRLSISSGYREWQVLALAIIHILLFMGNFLTTLKVIRQKVKADRKMKLLEKKYKFNNHVHIKNL
ncbi:hypothetical protein C0Q70_06932 [Pomacea canaliculata]|uniref:Transmembrane protein 120A n=1 Tax=Pomacea canaliculata TaxID=400727 RepID=A0A2T7PDN4_POMCA|nr:transmembrane protein 120B-like [Pomacea canaliculata]PVD31519.1 hypothetical protein C0Q70_06932 [Pomacea canaliculata]